MCTLISWKSNLGCLWIPINFPKRVSSYPQFLSLLPYIQKPLLRKYCVKCKFLRRLLHDQKIVLLSMMAHTWKARTQEKEARWSGVQGHPWPFSKFKASLNGTKPYLKTNQRKERRRVGRVRKKGRRQPFLWYSGHLTFDFWELTVGIKVDLYASCFWLRCCAKWIPKESLNILNQWEWAVTVESKMGISHLWTVWRPMGRG